MGKKYQKGWDDGRRELLMKLDGVMDEITEGVIEEATKRIMNIFNDHLSGMVQQETMTAIGKLIAGRIEVQTKFIKLDEVNE